MSLTRMHVDPIGPLPDTQACAVTYGLGYPDPHGSNILSCCLDSQLRVRTCVLEICKEQKKILKSKHGKGTGANGFSTDSQYTNGLSNTSITDEKSATITAGYLKHRWRW